MDNHQPLNSEVSSKRPREGRSSYAGSCFLEVWREIAAHPYVRLPKARVRVREALKPSTIRKLHDAAQRTLHARHDLLPHFDKLVHPVGVCLRGRWRITEPTPYTGLFRTGSEALIIARASENMGETRPGRLRFLGLAGKLYPTSAPEHLERLCTANFVMNENLLGTHTRHFAHATFSTDLVPFRLDTEFTPKLLLDFVIASVFAIADRAANFKESLRRQLYPIAELGESDPEQARAPRVLLLVGAAENRKVDTPDFREELDMAHHPSGIRYEIHVTDELSYFRWRGVHCIGEVVFAESVASESCDHRLHFRHPPHREHGRS